MKRALITALCVAFLASGCTVVEPQGSRAAAKAPLPTANYKKEKIEGWTVLVNPAFPAKHPRVCANTIKEVRFQLRRMKRALPAEKVRLLQTMRIWIEEKGSPAASAVSFHPTREWLVKHEANAGKAGGVEVADAGKFLKQSRGRPCALLYAFADALHWKLFRFNHPGINAAYEKLKESGKFKKVLDFSGQTRPHYGLAGPREFFTEFSQTYFGRGTSYPFLRAQLKKEAPEVEQAIVNVWYNPASYVPTKKYLRRQIEGWTVLVNPYLAADDPKLCAEVLGEIEVQLNRVRRLVPADKVRILRRTKIWVEEYSVSATCAAFHPDPRWLKAHGVNPDKAHCIEVTNAKNFAEWTKNGLPWIMFHELSHAYDWNMFRYKSPRILAAYERFVERSKKTSKKEPGDTKDKDEDEAEPVLEYTGAMRKPYALKNNMEFSEAYFDVNEIYPFVRAELEKYDPETAKLIRDIWYGPVPKSIDKPPEESGQPTSR